MSLESIFQEISSHSNNSWAKELGYLPIYTASPTAKILIVGQAPGRKAQESGLPWNDVSGNTLRDWLGINREVFYDSSKIALVPMDFYYPGKGAHGDLPPRKDFAPLWHPKIRAEMPNIRLTILVGQYSQNYYLGKNAKINLTETVRAYQEYLPLFLPLVHPSPLNFRWRSRNPWFIEQVIPDVRRIVQSII